MTKMASMSDAPLTEANLRKAMADLAARPVDLRVYEKLKFGAESVLAIQLAGLADALSDDDAMLLYSDHDPGDEEPEPDFLAILNAAIDRSLMTQHPRGAGGSP